MRILQHYKYLNLYNIDSWAKSNHQPNRDSIDSTYLFENLVLSNDESDKEISADRYYKNQDVTGSINKINLSLENSVDISNSNKNQFKFQERNVNRASNIPNISCLVFCIESKSNFERK